MKKYNSKSLYVILAVGLLLIFIGLIFFLALFGVITDFSSMILPILISLVGFANLYVFMAFEKKTIRFFLGLTLSLYGIFTLMLSADWFVAGLSELWPIYVFITAVTLFISGRVSGKIFAPHYDLPAIVFLFSGIIFILFSFDIIKISFSELALIICPLILIAAGVFLVVLFFQRKNILQFLPDNVLKELNEESDIDESE